MMATSAFLFVLLLQATFTQKGNCFSLKPPPPVSSNLYDEQLSSLYSAQLVYGFADLAEAARGGNITLEIPSEFPVESLDKFRDESIDFRGVGINHGGVSLTSIISLLKANQGQNLESVIPDSDFQTKLIHDALIADLDDDFFLATLRSIQQNVSCVYGVVRDRKHKRIIVTFRGSQPPDFSTRDWRTNLNARLAKLKTPRLIKDKMEGKLRKEVMVHKGFHDYLFSNTLLKGEQRYDKIIDDIKPLVEEGYKVYVTGHSLGGALATMFSFKLAGEKRLPWLPKPVTCISYAAPLGGTSDYRTAFEELEKEGLLRHLRINNEEDLVPATPPFSLGFRRRYFKHVGINLRLKKKGFEMIHSSKGRGLKNALKNSILKPLWRGALEFHLLPLHGKRLAQNGNELRGITIDDLYRNETVVGPKFKSAKRP